MQRHQQGLALPVVILFMALILVAMLVATSYLTLGAQGRNVSETQATRALFAADSLVNRVDSTVADLPPLPGGSSVTADAVKKYLKDNGLGSLTLLDGSTAELLQVTGADSNFDITFKGVVDGKAEKLVLKTYRFNSDSQGMMLNSPGAVTTYARFTVNSSPDIHGSTGGSGWFNESLNNTAVTTKSQIVANNSPYTTPLQVTLSNARNEKPGDYLKIDNHVFKVVSKTDNTLSILPVNQGSGSSFNANISSETPVQVAPLAVSAPFGSGSSVPSGSTMTIQVNDPGAFSAHSTKGDMVYIDYLEGGSTKTAVARVKARDLNAKTLTLDFTCSGCIQLPMNGKVPEGTPLRRDIKGVVSNNTVQASNKNSYTYIENDPRVRNPYGSAAPNETPPCPTGDLLFCDTFHMDKAEFLSQFGSQPTQPGNLDKVNGVAYVNGDVRQNNSNGPCGKGIVVITGNFDVNSTGCEFYGLIYVMGNVDLKGNIALNGSLVVQGTIAGGKTHIGSSGSDKKGGKLTYDLMALREASALLAGNKLKPQAGTWRQK